MTFSTGVAGVSSTRVVAMLARDGGVTSSSFGLNPRDCSESISADVASVSLPSVCVPHWSSTPDASSGGGGSTVGVSDVVICASCRLKHRNLSAYLPGCCIDTSYTDVSASRTICANLTHGKDKPNPQIIRRTHPIHLPTPNCPIPHQVPFPHQRGILRRTPATAALARRRRCMRR